MRLSVACRQSKAQQIVFSLKIWRSSSFIFSCLTRKSQMHCDTKAWQDGLEKCFVNQACIILLIQPIAEALKFHPDFQKKNRAIFIFTFFCSLLTSFLGSREPHKGYYLERGSYFEPLSRDLRPTWRLSVRCSFIISSRRGLKTVPQPTEGLKLLS